MNIHVKGINSGFIHRFVAILVMILLLAACGSNTFDVAEDCSGIECSKRDMEDLADYSIFLPEYVPSYLVFDSANFNPETQSVTLSYSHSDGSGEQLSVSQRPIGSDTIYQLEEYYPADAIRQVTIGDGVGKFVQGVYTSDEFDPSISNQQIVWQSQGMEFSIAATLPNNTAQQTLTRIAESMK